MSKVKVNRELFEALKKMEKATDEGLLNMLKKKMIKYNFISDTYSPINKISEKEAFEIYKYGYELEDSLEENDILHNVLNLLHSQTAKGLAKYGKTVNAKDYTTEQWIDHVSEEIIDTLVYLQCIKESMKNERRDNS